MITRLARLARVFFAVFIFRLGDGQNRRDQIGKTLADAGARLDDQMPLRGDRFRDRVGHRKLLRPGLVVRQPVGDPALGSENVGGGEHGRGRVAE